MVAQIPKAIREQTWIHYNGTKYIVKCTVQWCSNKITPFNFEVGHNIPSSKGGLTSIENLRPLCSACNKGMGNRYTIDEFSKLSEPLRMKSPIRKNSKISKKKHDSCIRRKRIIVDINVNVNVVTSDKNNKSQD